MKLIALPLLASLVLASVSSTFAADPAGAATPPASAEKNSFQEVTSQLDPGGNVYLYLGTEQCLEGLAGKISEYRHLLDSIPDLPDEVRENIDKGVNIVTNLIKSSGLEDISGLGISSIAREKGFYHSKIVVHHYPGRGSGFGWNLCGQKAHPLDTLNLLSTNTALATFGDLDVPLLWSTIQKQAAQSGFPQATDLLKELPAHFEKATGLNWEKVLASLGGEYGLVFCLNDSRKVKIPLPGGDEPMEIPEPSLMIVAKTRDDTIFNRVDAALTKSGQTVFRTDKPNLKMRTLSLPLPLPFPVAPSIASAEGYLFIATSDLLIQEALAVKAGTVPGLKSTPEFQRLAKESPAQGNQFTFVSQRLSRTIADLQRRAVASSVSASQRQWLETLLEKSNHAYLYSVSANTDQGWVAVANGNQHPGTLLAVSAVIPASLVAAMALPAVAKAKSAAQRNSCIANLRKIDRAKKDWALENNKGDDALPKKTDLLPFLQPKQFPVCPSGGDYTLNPVSERPECSVDGHAIP
jgi:hypothetical protein